MFPPWGVRGVLKYPDSKKRAVSAQDQTLNSTLWITQETLLDTVSSVPVSSRAKSPKLRSVDRTAIQKRQFVVFVKTFNTWRF